MKKMQRWSVVAVLALTGVACGGGGDTGATDTETPTSSATPTPVAEATVSATGTAVTWSPAQVTITAGGKVTWTWDGSLPHNVAAKDKSWTSGEANNKDEFVKTFDAAGTYDFLCEVHGAGMSGTVTVV